MADNPLLPQDRLREMHALMLRIRDLEKRRPKTRMQTSSRPAREALIAATALHLKPGDLFSAPADDGTLRELAPASPSGAPSHDLPASLRIPLCAGAARGMKAAGVDNVTVAFANARLHEPLWTDAIAWAHRDELALILLCADVQQTLRTQRARRHDPPLTWTSVTQLARKLRIPLFPVDGHDAVAVYRVMQEITGRARSSGGPSIVWAVLNGGPLPRREQPIARLEAYMAARNISLRA